MISYDDDDGGHDCDHDDAHEYGYDRDHDRDYDHDLDDDHVHDDDCDLYDYVLFNFNHENVHVCQFGAHVCDDYVFDDYVYDSCVYACVYDCGARASIPRRDDDHTVK